MTTPAPLRIGPATRTVHLDYNGFEDVDLVVDVVDADEVPVFITSASAIIGAEGRDPLFEWSAAAGNLVLLPDLADPTHYSRVQLTATRAETLAWSRTWRTSGWQLDVVDLFGRSKRPCEGQVRARPSRRST